MKRRRAGRRANPPTGRVWGADVLLDTVRQDPGRAPPCCRGCSSGASRRTARSGARSTAPALVIGHDRDPVHPFSDSDALVGELPNARLLRADSLAGAATHARAPDGRDRRVPGRVLEAAPQGRCARRAPRAAARASVALTQRSSPLRSRACQAARRRRSAAVASARSASRPRPGRPPASDGCSSSRAAVLALAAIGAGHRRGRRRRRRRRQQGRRRRPSLRLRVDPRAQDHGLRRGGQGRRAARSRPTPARAATHLPSDTAVNDKYKTNPPTSGNHRPTPAEDGVYAPATRRPRRTTSTRSSTAASRSSTRPARRQARSRPAQALFNEKVKGVAGYHSCSSRTTPNMPYGSRPPPGRTCSAARRSTTRLGRDPRLPRALRRQGPRADPVSRLVPR